VLVRSAPILLAATGLAFLSTGCPLVEIEAEIEDTCMSYTGVEVDGVAGETSLVKSFAFDDLGGLGELADLDAEVHFAHFDARLVDGVKHFDFVQAAKVTISAPDGDVPALVVYECDGDCATEGSVLTVDATSEVDALEYLRQDSLVVDVELTGQMPDKKFTMDIDVCVNGKVRYVVDP
jgi:hypothetical protein